TRGRSYGARSSPCSSARWFCGRGAAARRYPCRGSQVDEARDAAQRQRRRFTRRALMLGAGQAGLFGLLGWKLHALQVEDAPKYALLADENRIAVQLLAPVRGPILDRFGRTLADNLESYRVLLVPDLTRSVGESLDRLAA